MTDRPHVVIPGDVTSSFATSEGLTGDAAHLATLMSTARSRLVIATTSPDASQCRQALIWMQPGPCVVARTATTPDGETETHMYQIDNEEIPHVAAAISPLTPNPAVFDGPPVLPTAIVYAAQQGTTEQTAQLLENYSSYGPSDSAFAQALVAQRWAYTTWIRKSARTRDPLFRPPPSPPSSHQPPPTGSRPRFSRPAPDLTSPSTPSTTRSCGHSSRISSTCHPRGACHDLPRSRMELRGG